jgi:hypothetical protein
MRKKSLRVRKHRRAQKSSHAVREQDQHEFRLKRIEGGWKPPTEEEKDKESTERQTRIQAAIIATEERSKDRRARRRADIERHEDITQRLKSWMAENMTKREQRLETAQDEVGGE